MLECDICNIVKDDELFCVKCSSPVIVICKDCCICEPTEYSVVKFDMMRKFSITSQKWENEIILQYYDNGTIFSIEMPEVIDVNALMWWATHLPVTLDLLDYVKSKSNARFIEIVEIDFIHFWNVYDKKEGSKDLAEQYWDGAKKTMNKRPISEDEKMQIMAILPKYTARFKGEKKQFQPLASTFLNQRAWVAELERADNSNKNLYINVMTEKLLKSWT